MIVFMLCSMFSISLVLVFVNNIYITNVILLAHGKVEHSGEGVFM